ncbi:hypothetical protein JOC86_002391 [Bacillus pakistanensis]|uniref:Capsid protein n=1 Tax=Rossellomorea pakistanensis TaxID=992288 RepID=A0ABS2NDF8_9BACI|nr:capsid protein [Bacillus pakistanensis]MBM7585849.1 hypothetical protein [Bacillus pakistanensis]
MPGEFYLQSAHKFEIQTGTDTTTQEPIYSRLAGGLNSVEPSNNEELSQDKYLDGDGYGETDVIGAQQTLSFSGHRKYGDEAQDFIYSKRLELGNARRTNFRWTEPDGGILEGPATIVEIGGPSGEAGSKGEISFGIHFNGKPTYTPPVA